MLNYIECPVCESQISWRIIYSNSERTGKAALHQKHSMRCLFCQTVFTYTPIIAKSRPWWRFGFTVSEITVTEMTIVQRGHIG